MNEPPAMQLQDWITAQLFAAAITFFYGLSLTFAPNQGMKYVVFDAFRELAPVWCWGVVAMAGAVLHFAGYKTRWRHLLLAGMGVDAAFWFFVAGSALRAGWYNPQVWTGPLYIAVNLRSAWRVGYWTRK